MSTSPAPLPQVATPFSTGEGGYLPNLKLVVVPEHFVRDSPTAVVTFGEADERLARIVYLDEEGDLALLRFAAGDSPEIGPALTPVEAANRLGFAPALLEHTLAEFAAGEGRPGARCGACGRITFERGPRPAPVCAHCGTDLVLPGTVEEMAPEGVAATVEEVVRTAGYDPRLTRRGPNLWRIRRGSATILITYHEQSGLVTGDAYLCRLPEPPTAAVFAYLLRQNDVLRQLTFSIYGQDVLLSLLIYDRYLAVPTAVARFDHLFERADHYDDVLVERFGARWRNHSKKRS